MIKHIRIIFSVSLLFILSYLNCDSYKNGPSPRTEYKKLSESITKGWNTWDNNSIMTQVLLPEGLAFQMMIRDTVNNDTLILAFTGNRVKGSEKVRTLAHTPDGSYTDFTMTWRDFGLRIQTATRQHNDLYILVTPDQHYQNPGYLAVQGKMIYGDEGTIRESDRKIEVELPDQSLTLNLLNNLPGNNKDGQLNCGFENEILLSTDKNIRTDELKNIIYARNKKYQAKKESYGRMAEAYNAVQNALNWMVVYDPEKDRAITPVARPWTYGWGEGKPGGYILFCWDNFFAAYMHALNSKKLAYNEAIQMCNEIEELGFVPNFSAPHGLKSRDRSQPPVGSMMILGIYNLHPEKWFLEYVFDNLLTWNRWWKDKRDYNGYLCWGSNPYDPVFDDKREFTQNNFSAASNESGLDNTPMYDGVPFDTTDHLLEIADAGLMSLYIADCKALAKIASILDNKEAEQELLQRAEKYNKQLETMWNEEFGLYLNKRMDTGEFSKRISPTNFYPLISATPTQKQAQRMIKEHFYNPEEFWGEWIMPSIARNDTAYTGRDYWRGSIWAPMNFLVYLGMLNYNLPEARKDLADKSHKLLMKEWLSKGYIRENYSAETGGDPGYRSEHFYHWGALLGMINLIEYNKTEAPMDMF